MTKVVRASSIAARGSLPMSRCRLLLRARIGILLSAGLLVVVGCEKEIASVRGVITVDGTPVESGVVSLQSTTGKENRGASIVQGRFDMGSKGDLTPGEYLVTVQCFQSTGRTFNDPQRGPIPEKVQLAVADDGQKIEIDSDNAENLKLEFHTKASN